MSKARPADARGRWKLPSLYGSSVPGILRRNSLWVRDLTSSLQPVGVRFRDLGSQSWETGSERWPPAQ